MDTDPVRRALTASLVGFAAGTRAKIIAEGIETADELEAVRALGVGYAQGYYLGRPVPLADLQFERHRSEELAAQPTATSTACHREMPAKPRPSMSWRWTNTKNTATGTTRIDKPAKMAPTGPLW